MQPWLLMTVSLIALPQLCQAASEDARGFCDPQSEDFYRRQSTVPWEPVPRERIAEADYYERTFEARIRYGEEELFAYKVMMNIRGKPTYVFVALLDERQAVIDLKPLASKAKVVLGEAASKVVREQRARAAYVSLASVEYDILLWPWRSSWYFSMDAAQGFSVFEIAGNTVGYVCTHQP